MNQWKIIGLSFLILASALALWAAQAVDITNLVGEIEALGSLAWLGFMLVYALATVLFLPGSVLTLAGGSLFGPWLGTFVNLTGATLGAALSFIIARHLAGDWVERKTAGQLKRMKDGVEEEGWRFVVFVRLVPLFPFNLLNYALGLTRIPFHHYLLATYVCMLPGALAYTYLGYAGREALAGGEGMIQKSLLALALLASVMFLPRLIARVRKTDKPLQVADLRTKMTEDANMLLLDVRSDIDFVGPQGHVPQAKNIPLEALASQLMELDTHKSKPIALICTTDKRSKKAAELLRKNGFSQVWVVGGGMTEWNKLGLPVSTSL